MNFPKINRDECPPAAGSQCGGVDDQGGGGGGSGDSPYLTLEPGFAIMCDQSTIQFHTFLVNSLGQQELTLGVTYASSDPSVLMVDAASGAGTKLGEGIVTITATWHDLITHAQITCSGDGDCCADVMVEVAVCRDRSASMFQAFGTGTKDGVGQVIVKHAFAPEFGGILTGPDSKDKACRIDFSDTPQLRVEFTGEYPVYATNYLGKGTTTNIPAAIDLALEQFSEDTQRVILVVSDGQEWPDFTTDERAAFMQKCQDFKEAGGLIICLGIAANQRGFGILQEMSSGGFFVNVHISGTTSVDEDCATLIPTMTSNTTPSGVADASAEVNPAYKAFDNNPVFISTDNSNGWKINGGSGWLRYKFPSAQVANKYTLTIWKANYSAPKDFKLQGSQDGSSWTDLDSQTDVDWGFASGSTRAFAFVNTTAYLYYRLNVTSTIPHGTNPDILVVLEMQLLSCGTQVLDNFDLAADIIKGLLCLACAGDRESGYGYGCTTHDLPGPQSPDPNAPSDPESGEGGGDGDGDGGDLPQEPMVLFVPSTGTDIGGGMDVTLSVPGHPGATIKYSLTTDGSIPPEPNTNYIGPIHINPLAAGTVVKMKARATETGYNPSNLSSAYYVQGSSSNGAPIVWNNDTMAPATPYPSEAVVSGVVGLITSVKVKLKNINAQEVEPKGILLVSPTGTKVLLLHADQRGDNAIVGSVDVTFDQTAANFIPFNLISDPPLHPFLTTGSYKPTVEEGGELVAYPSPAPSPPYQTDLTAFNGENPNGTWKLFVIHIHFYTLFSPNHIDGGWELILTTA